MEIDPNEISKKVESIFEASGEEDEGMWKVASKYATQYDSLQILALSKLEYIAGICSPEIQKRLRQFKDFYIQLCNNRNTAMYMLRMAELNGLKKYFQGIQGKINIEK